MSKKINKLKHVPKNFKVKKKNPDEFRYALKDYQGRPNPLTIEQMIAYGVSDRGGILECVEDEVNELRKIIARLIEKMPKEERDEFVKDHIIPINFSL